MAIGQPNGVIQRLRRAMLLRDGAGLPDGRLLADYISRRDEGALAALVQRHAPMVWGVCRRVLGNHHDAEDAFQATFLVLVRKAASIAAPELLANWLYGVAHQTALKARATVAKRKVRERQVAEMPEPGNRSHGPGVRHQEWDDVQPLLDQELSRLPGIYRAVIVLCDLEGKTRKEAARHLGLAEGTVGSRLARARMLLAKRLAERGVALSGGALAAVLAQNVASAGVPSLVVSKAIQAASLFAAGQASAAGMVSVKVAAIAEGVLRAMMMSKLKAVVAVVLVLGFLGTGATVLSCRTAMARSDKPPIAAERSDSIEGTWEIVSALYDGKPGNLAGKRIWTITQTHIEYDDTRKDAYVLDSKANPNQINVTQIRPGDERADGGKFIGIYEVKGDTLKICVAFRDALPTAFESTAGSGQNLHTLKRVKTPQKLEQEKDGFTAWGKEIGGLQAGLGYHPGQKRTYSHGETVKLVVRVRNVGKEAVKFQYLRQFFLETPPAVTDGDGKPVILPRISVSGLIHVPVDVTLAPGKEIELTGSQPFYELNLELRPASEKGNNRSRTLYGTGKFQLQYEQVFGDSTSGTITLDPALSKLATGKLELEIKAKARVKTPPKDLGKIEPPGGAPLPLFKPGTTTFGVDQLNKVRERLEAVPEKDLEKWVVELERIMDKKLDGEINEASAKQACRTYFVTHLSVAFDDLKWNAKTADKLFERAQTMPASAVKVWKKAFEELLKKEIGQTATTNLAGGPAYAVPLVLIPVEALHEGQKYSAERGKKYLARLKQLTADDVSLWKDQVDEFGGTNLDAAVNIILLDDYFDKEMFQRDKFKAAIEARKK